jgi:hypothetical protein
MKATKGRISPLDEGQPSGGCFDADDWRAVAIVRAAR